MLWCMSTKDTNIRIVNGALHVGSVTAWSARRQRNRIVLWELLSATRNAVFKSSDSNAVVEVVNCSPEACTWKYITFPPL